MFRRRRGGANKEVTQHDQPLFFAALWLIFIGLLIWKLIWSRTFWRHGSRSDATALLRERFARGEINAEEYQSRGRILKGR